LLGRLAVLLGWCGAAFAVQTAFAISVTSGASIGVVLVYLLGFSTMFPLHPRTHGPLSLVVAFGLGWALLVEGIAFAMSADDTEASRRLLVAGLLALPLLALVVRRRSFDPSDEWFGRLAPRVVLLALVVALPLSAYGLFGAFRADLAPHERARRALGHDPLEILLFEGLPFDSRARGRRCWSSLESSWSAVSREIRARVNGACRTLAADDPWRACTCADDFLASELRTLRDQRDRFRYVALASALPWAIAALFAWRGRRRAPGVHARITE
jgi:hypothetical protein